MYIVVTIDIFTASITSSSNLSFHSFFHPFIRLHVPIFILVNAQHRQSVTLSLIISFWGILPACLSVCLSFISVCFCLHSVYLSACLSINRSFCSSVILFVCLTFRLSVHLHCTLTVCLLVCLSIYQAVRITCMSVSVFLSICLSTCLPAILQV